jgi:tetratricopeptide (TPR) repeat protein
MIEAACTACGNINRVAEGDLPSGTKFVICASCKARVPIPHRAKTGGDISDLPSPKRTSALGGEASKPAPRSGLAAALDAELPAPRGGPRPATPPPALELDDLLAPPGSVGITDLPAPKGALPSRPAASAEKPGLADLPAPKARRPELPPLKPPPTADLPAPKRPGGSSDLPAPKPRPPAMPPAIPTIDLPPAIDLPMPKHPAGIIDLPAPKPGAAISDLPMPKPASRAVAPDLLTPVSKQPGTADLPAPKGFFDDLPQPATPAVPQSKSETGLPAPKGFFDDLPGRVNASTAAKPDLPAPKGFFDDLPGRVNTHKPATPEIPEVPAPKGFFDDLPGRVNTHKPERPEPPEVPAPKGYFEDLPGRTNQNKPQPPAPKGFFDDLPQPTRAKPITSAPVELELDDGQIERPEPIDTGPELDLGTAEASSASSFDDLDLSAPSAVPARSLDAAKREKVAPAPPQRDSMPAATFKAIDQDGPGLELAEPRPVAAATPKLEPKQTKNAQYDPVVVQQRARRRKIVLAAVLVVAALGAGGFVLYRRHAASVARAEQIELELGNARNALSAKDAEHWQRAAMAANKVVELDPKNPEAIGIAAEGLFAQGLADGRNAKAKFGQGRQLLSRAAEAGLTSNQITRASALQSIASNQGEAAVAKLTPIVNAAPKDPTLALYMGWALAAKGDFPAAITAFDLAATGESVKLPALHGRGRARLAQGDQAGATADFAAILALDSTHLGAQVGLAAGLPASKAQQQEADLLALLQRKDIAAGDSRAVLEAWLLLANGARRGNRLDVARERYRKALELSPVDVAAMTGLAETELRDGKLDASAELLKKALELAKEDVHAQLAQSELSIARKNLSDAGARLDVLAARNPPLPALDQMRVKLLQGRLFEAQGKDDDAVTAYLESAKLAGDQDLTPTLAATSKLGALADKATKAKETAKAAEYRGRADELLAKLAESAKKDPQIALTLGTAYLQTGDAAKAEPWLRRAVENRADADSLYQLAKALARLGKPDEAIVGLKKAVELAPARAEIGLELARTYEVAGNDNEADTLYGKLVATPEPSLELRARAGRFFARRGDLKRAGEQAVKILAVDPQHPAGLYLKGEGLLGEGKYDDARKLFGQAASFDRDPQYLDAQGRAAELVAAQTGDTKMQDAAILAYQGAAELAPTMFNPHAGQGRLYINRREASKAVAPLLVAAKLRPADGDVAYLMGLAYKDLQQQTAAIEWLKRAISLKPSADAGWHLGQLYLEANKGALGASALAAATRLALDSEKQTGKPISWLTEALHRLGRAYLDLNNNAGAKDAFNLYIGRNPPPGPQRSEAERALLRLN